VIFSVVIIGMSLPPLIAQVLIVAEALTGYLIAVMHISLTLVWQTFVLSWRCSSHHFAWMRYHCAALKLAVSFVCVRSACEQCKLQYNGVYLLVGVRCCGDKGVDVVWLLWCMSLGLIIDTSFVNCRHIERQWTHCTRYAVLRVCMLLSHVGNRIQGWLYRNVQARCSVTESLWIVFRKAVMVL
jgi:hypothetical protein